MSDNMKVEDTQRKFTFRAVISWIVGGILLILSIIFLFMAPITGIVLLVATAITLPPAAEFLQKKLRLAFSGPLKVIIVIILIILAPLVGDVREKAIEEGLVSDTSEKGIVETKQVVTKDIPDVVDEIPVVPPQPIPPPPQPLVTSKSYQQVFAFSGNGAKKSEPFSITGDRFKIKYDCTGELCQAFLRSTQSEFDLEIIMNTDIPVKDENIFYGSGEYYIEANTLGGYTMTVEDYK